MCPFWTVNTWYYMLTIKTFPENLTKKRRKVKQGFFTRCVWSQKQTSWTQIKNKSLRELCWNVCRVPRCWYCMSQLTCVAVHKWATLFCLFSLLILDHVPDSELSLVLLWRNEDGSVGRLEWIPTLLFLLIFIQLPFGFLGGCFFSLYQCWYTSESNKATRKLCWLMREVNGNLCILSQLNNRNEMKLTWRKITFI